MSKRKLLRRIRRLEDRQRYDVVRLRAELISVLTKLAIANMEPRITLQEDPPSTGPYWPPA